jgi:short-subunit dehydrogenase
MTVGLKPPPFAADPEQVARVVLKAIDKGTPVVYAPAVWGGVMLVIRNLPRWLMRRVEF